MRRADAVIIGGGAAGSMCAALAAARGLDVALLEPNRELGRKLRITGKGRCNVTNDLPAEDFFQNVVHNAKFLRSCIYAFPPERTMRFLEEGGLPLKVERGGARLSRIRQGERRHEVPRKVLQKCRRHVRFFRASQKNRAFAEYYVWHNHR